MTVLAPKTMHTMNAQSSDTHPLAEEMLISLFRKLSVAGKISKVRSLSATMMQLSHRSIRRNHPDLDEQDLAIKCLSYHYGGDLAARFRAYLESSGS